MKLKSQYYIILAFPSFIIQKIDFVCKILVTSEISLAPYFLNYNSGLFKILSNVTLSSS
ncbi:hypothetical protein K4I04_1662 [Streptococcus sanguinis]|nr:hypothetical protein [Streptococcus sanguinis]